MKTIRFLAAGLLTLTGLLHGFQMTSAPLTDPAIAITVAFGVIYLALGLLLIRGRRIILWLAAILPLVGFLLAALGMLTKPTLLGGLFMAIDLIIAGGCFILLFRRERKELT